jgi:hypothetical protein
MHYLQGPPCELNTNKGDWPNPRDFSKIHCIFNQKHMAKHDSKLCYGWQKKKIVVVEGKITFPLGCFPMWSSLDSTQEGCRVNGAGSAPQENTAFLTPNGHYGSGRMCKDDFVVSSISMYNM